MSNIELKNAGLKITLPRVKILSKLDGLSEVFLNLSYLDQILINYQQINNHLLLNPIHMG